MHPLFLLTLFAAAAAILCFACDQLGVFERLPLALGPLAFDKVVDRAARRFGDAPLFTTDLPCAWLPSGDPDASSWSALKLQTTAARLADLLVARLGVRPGDRVAVFKENHLDLHVFNAAILRAGAIACRIAARFQPTHLGAYLERLGARLLISDVKTLEGLRHVPGSLGGIRQLLIAAHRAPGAAPIEARLRAKDRALGITWLGDALSGSIPARPSVKRGAFEVLLVVHTSGTTGVPKGVALENGAQTHALRAWLRYTCISRRRDRGLVAVPNNHQAVILSFHGLLALGVPTHWHGACGQIGFDAAAVMRALAERRCTGYFGFPVTYMQMREVPLAHLDLHRMRFWASTGDACHAVVQRHFTRVGSTFTRLGIPLRGSVFLDAQGSSEVGTPSVLRFVTPLTRRFDRRVGRRGSAPLAPELRVMRTDGTLAAQGEPGRLEVRGPSVFRGYWNDPAATERAFRAGWFFTGDIASIGADGHLIQLDREVDVVHTPGGAVYTLPIEEKLLEHPAVFDVCVYGARQPDGTLRVASAVALRPGVCVDPHRLHLELDARLTPAERLGRLEIMPWSAFPMGATGKTLKRAFREDAERRAHRARRVG